MTGQQLELYRDRNTRKRKSPELARRMIAALSANGAWLTREQFRIRHGLTPRECRLGRVAAHGRIIQGQRGYKLITHATPEETAECLANFQSQITALQKEWQAVNRRAHSAVNKGRRAMA